MRISHPYEVRKEQESRADLTLVADKELGLGVKLIEALATNFQPEKTESFTSGPVKELTVERSKHCGWDASPDFQIYRVAFLAWLRRHAAAH